MHSQIALQRENAAVNGTLVGLLPILGIALFVIPGDAKTADASLKLTLRSRPAQPGKDGKAIELKAELIIRHTTRLVPNTNQ